MAVAEDSEDTQREEDEMKGRKSYILLAILVLGAVMLIVGLNYLEPSCSRPPKTTPESAGYWDGMVPLLTFRPMTAKRKRKPILKVILKVLMIDWRKSRTD